MQLSNHAAGAGGGRLGTEPIGLQHGRECQTAEAVCSLRKKVTFEWQAACSRS